MSQATQSLSVESAHTATGGPFAIRLCRTVGQPERLGNYLCRLPAGNTGSRAVSPRAALLFPSVQAAEAGLAEHLSGLPGERWDAVYEIVEVAHVG